MKVLNLEVEGATKEEISHFTEILDVLLAKGALTGMRAGSTTIHFTNEGEFSGIELSYWPYRKRPRN